MGHITSKAPGGNSPPSSVVNHWERLPEDCQAAILDKLPPLEAARVSVVSRGFRAVVAQNPRWSELLVGPGFIGPLPERPQLCVGARLADAISGCQSRRMLQARLSVDLSPGLEFLRSDNLLFEAQLLDWQASETKTGNPHAEEAAQRIGEAKNSSSLSLDVSGLPIRTLPTCIGQLTQLQYLDSHSCTQLAALPEFIGQLTQLRYLVLRSCTHLKKLPESIGQLTQLQYLNLSSCTHLEKLPESIGQLTQLQKLNLRSCTHLEKLPESIGQLTQLQNLILHSCTRLETLPESIGRLTQLQELELGSCTHLEKLPESIGRLTQLQELDLGSCTHLEKLPESIAQLTQLAVTLLNASNYHS